MKELPPNWPFATPAEREAYDAANSRAFAILREQHERFMAAHAERERAKHA